MKRCTKISWKKISILACVFYLSITLYTAYILIKRRFDKTTETPSKHIKEEYDWNPWGEEKDEIHHKALFNSPKVTWNKDWAIANQREVHQINAKPKFTVEIWGKAAIGLYLWEHILGGELQEKLGGIWKYGHKQLHDIEFVFRTGPGVVPSKVPKNVVNLVLVLNGREKKKVEFAQAWLDSLSSFTHLKNVAVVLLGNEKCQNDWIKQYMTAYSRSGKVQFVFLVYDSPDVDDQNFYQWPLGVATYRNFPKLSASEVPLNTERDYKCNFMGTVYSNSSRETLLHIIKNNPRCYLKYRTEWLPQETPESLDEYVRTLVHSDLTFNPVGVNTECYRIYEAMSLGSVPVVEDIRTPGQCKQGFDSPLRLLKKYNAPIIYVKNWKDIGVILENEKQLSPVQIVKRRTDLLRWYENFKSKMREKFVNVIWHHFFSEQIISGL